MPIYLLGLSGALDEAALEAELGRLAAHLDAGPACVLLIDCRQVSAADVTVRHRMGQWLSARRATLRSVAVLATTSTQRAVVPVERVRLRGLLRRFDEVGPALQWLRAECESRRDPTSDDERTDR